MAYAYDFQIVDETPHTLDDERVEYIVTERRTIRCTANKNEGESNERIQKTNENDR